MKVNKLEHYILSSLIAAFLILLFIALFITTNL